MRKKKRRWLFIIPVLLILAGAAAWYFKPWKSEMAVSAAISQRTAVIRRGDLNVTISGSGSVYPSVSTSIKVEADGTVKENYMEEGKKVKAGEVLLILNKYDNEISEKKLENNLEQKKLAYQKLLKKYEALTVKAPVSGKITDIMVEEGDDVNAGRELVTITDDSVLCSEVVFKDASADDISQAGHVTVHLPDYMTSISGDIISVRQDGKNVISKILVNNPGELTEGTSIWCETEYENNTYQSSAGSLKWYTKKTVYAETSGMVQAIHVNRNDYVDAGSVLITLYDEEAEINLKSALIQVEEAEYNIQEFRFDADKYIVTAPMDGYLTSVKDLLAGDSLKEGDTVATLINTDEMVFSVYIDELDINRVAIGQEVKVTAEAVEETSTNPIIGKVTNIALVGNSSNGVTVYPVTITIPGSEGLKVGMNVDGEIQVVNKENVLLVPLEALQKAGNSYMVWVKSDNSDISRFDNMQQANNAGISGFDYRQPGKNANISRFDIMQQENDANISSSDNRQPGLDWNISGFDNKQPGNDENAGSEGRNTGSNELSRQEGDIQNGTGNGNRMNFRPGGSPAGDNTGISRSQNTERTQRRSSPVNSYYEGASMVRVEIGQYNENYAEVISGLDEGDVVVLPMQASNTNSTSTLQQRRGQFPGGFTMPMSGGMGGGGNFGGLGGGRP